MKQRIIGLTGGIATGKTTVTDYLAKNFQLPILDADLYARQALTEERLAKISDRYGKLIIDDQGNLDRRKLGAIIFSSEVERQWLETLIHPYIQKCLISEAQRLAPATVVMAIPISARHFTRGFRSAGGSLRSAGPRPSGDLGEAH